MEVNLLLVAPHFCVPTNNPERERGALAGGERRDMRAATQIWRFIKSLATRLAFTWISKAMERSWLHVTHSVCVCVYRHADRTKNVRDIGEKRSETTFALFALHSSRSLPSALLPRSQVIYLNHEKVRSRRESTFGCLTRSPGSQVAESLHRWHLNPYYMVVLS